MGDLEGEDAYCRKICKDVGIVVVSVDYRLAPKHPFPIPLDDCVASCHWALENSDSLRTKSGKVVLAGTSAGANLALAVALKLNEVGKGEVVQGVIAVVPPTIAPEVIPESLKKKYTSYDEHAQHTVNTAPAMKMFFGKIPGTVLIVIVLANENRCLWSRPKRSVCFRTSPSETERSISSLPSRLQPRYAERRWKII